MTGAAEEAGEERVSTRAGKRLSLQQLQVRTTQLERTEVPEDCRTCGMS